MTGAAGDAATRLVVPSLDALPDYVRALRRGWAADTMRGAAAAAEELEAIDADAAAFIASLTDRDARGGPIRLADGRLAERLPGRRLWIVDGDGVFCGSIGLRWRPGTDELPPHVLGHCGYSVVAWRRGRGHAKAALRLARPIARAEGLHAMTLTTDPSNVASQRVIEACGGVLVGRFDKPIAFGGGEALRWRIDLSGVAPDGLSPGSPPAPARPTSAT